jgi:hypothetical protein
MGERKLDTDSRLTIVGRGRVEKEVGARESWGVASLSPGGRRGESGAGTGRGEAKERCGRLLLLCISCRDLINFNFNWLITHS